MSIFPADITIWCIFHVSHILIRSCRLLVQNIILANAQVSFPALLRAHYAIMRNVPPFSTFAHLLPFLRASISCRCDKLRTQQCDAIQTKLITTGFLPMQVADYTAEKGLTGVVPIIWHYKANVCKQQWQHKSHQYAQLWCFNVQPVYRTQNMYPVRIVLIKNECPNHKQAEFLFTSALAIKFTLDW